MYRVMDFNYAETSLSPDFTFIRTTGCRILLFVSALVMWIKLNYPTDTAGYYSQKHVVFMDMVKIVPPFSKGGTILAVSY